MCQLPYAGPNHEERGYLSVPMLAFLARSSSSVRLTRKIKSLPGAVSSEAEEADGSDASDGSDG